MAEISFPPEEYLDGVTDLVMFPAQLDGREIPCAVEIEALQEACHADLGDPMPAFHANRPVIEAAAARLIEARRFERNGGIVVRAEDL